MLSIVIYGRNDSHGYNLHKRAALSLNCMAEVLDHDDDEIVFVDYNTADDLPTFPEAIQDTLTAKARRLLRILRIRPDQHEALRHRTHLVALESLSRNVAVRRANPANRWMLSTNPDMIFLPRRSGQSLSAVAAGLEDGCYHLPRFEIPETIWEAYDRMDPAGTLAQLAQQGRRLHINDVIYGSDAALFDGHGDFQLLLRQDIEAVGGFHEGMLNGWHVDSNMAIRIKLLRGEVRSLLDSYFGYHCDHTRMASIGHGRDRLENDLMRYCDDVTAPTIPGQMDTWGLAGVDLEEIRLSSGNASLTARAIEAALPPLEMEYTEGAYVGTSFDDPRYPAPHVLPFLCDLLVTQRRDSRIAWFGARPAMLAPTVVALRTLGFTQPVRIGASCAPSLGTVPGIEIVADESLVREADLFVFEFGAFSQDGADGGGRHWTDDDMIRLAPVREQFLTLAEHEIQAMAEGTAPRRVVTINAIYNHFELLVNQTIAVNRTPYSSRLRQGFVLPVRGQRRPPTVSPLEIKGWLAAAMKRRQPVPITEVVRLTSYLHELLHGAPQGRRLNLLLQAAEPLMALCGHPGLRATEGAEALDRLRDRLARERASAMLAPRLAVPVAGQMPGTALAPCRLSCLEDWEEDAVIALAQRHYAGQFAANSLRREQDRWARLMVLHQATLRGFGHQGRALVVASQADDLYDVLSTLAARVDVVDRHGDGPPLADRPMLQWRDPSRLHFGPTMPEGGEYDLAVFCRHTLDACGTLADLAAAAVEAARCLRPGGLLALTCRMRVDGGASVLPPELAASDGLADAARTHLGLDRLPAAPPALTAATLDRTAFTAEDRLNPHFVAADGGALFTTATWMFLKQAEAAADGPACFAAACGAAQA